eukprot:4872981-Amphidinium_carterae.1
MHKTQNMPMTLYHMMTDVLANFIITFITKFLMVAEWIQLVGALRLGQHYLWTEATSTCFLLQNKQHTSENYRRYSRAISRMNNK